MAIDAHIRTDLCAARDAYDELGKALETGAFSPPEAHHWKYRAADAMKAFMGACGWHVSGADPRVQTLQAALREALAGWRALAENEGVPMTFTDAESARADELGKLVTEDGLNAYDQLLMALRRGLREALDAWASDADGGLFNNAIHDRLSKLAKEP